MFSPSARRVAFKSPLAKVAPTISTTVSRVTASKALPSCNHQRRLSSSKPSTPANGPKRVAEGQDLPTTSTRTKAEGEKKASPKAGRRKEKDAVAAKTGKGKEEEAVKGVSNLLKGIRKAAPLSAAVKVPARNEMQILPRVQNTNQVDPKGKDYKPSIIYILRSCYRIRCIILLCPPSPYSRWSRLPSPSHR